MPRALPFLSSVLLFAIGTSVHAQDIAGSWQGTLTLVPAGPPQRLVVDIAKRDSNSLKGTITFIDVSPDGSPLAVSFTPPSFRFDVNGLSYLGRMAEDGNTIAGVFTTPTPAGGKRELPLTFARAVPETKWTYSGPAALPPMAAAADPSFELATIRPTPPGTGNGHALFLLGRRKFEAANCTAMELIKIAYFIRGRQVIGGPKWINETLWSVTAQTDSDIPGQPSEAQTRIMVRKLLEQRFGLKVRRTQKDFAVYAMVVDKPSPGLSRSDSQDKPMLLAGHPAADGLQTIQFANATMKDFAAFMMNSVQTHQIVDETALTGKYDFKIVMPGAAFAPSPGTEDLPDPAFIKAIQPLGLKFVVRKETLDVVLVDELTLPTEN